MVLIVLFSIARTQYPSYWNNTRITSALRRLISWTICQVSESWHSPSKTTIEPSISSTRLFSLNIKIPSIDGSMANLFPKHLQTLLRESVWKSTALSNLKRAIQLRHRSQSKRFHRLMRQKSQKHNKFKQSLAFTQLRATSLSCRILPCWFMITTAQPIRSMMLSSSSSNKSILFCWQLSRRKVSAERWIMWREPSTSTNSKSKLSIAIRLLSKRFSWRVTLMIKRPSLPTTTKFWNSSYKN